MQWTNSLFLWKSYFANLLVMFFSDKKDIDSIFFLHLNFISSQSQMDVDSGIETMEVDDSDMKFEIKRRRVYSFNN